MPGVGKIVKKILGNARGEPFSAPTDRNAEVVGTTATIAKQVPQSWGGRVGFLTQDSHSGLGFAANKSNPAVLTNGNFA